MLVKACQTSSLLLFKFWQGLYLLMSSYNLIYTMNFTMKYDIVPFSHILVHSKFRIFGLAEAQILSEPNLISTNERRDNIRPMRNGYYFPISGSHLRPAVYLGEFSFPLSQVFLAYQVHICLFDSHHISLCTCISGSFDQLSLKKACRNCSIDTDISCLSYHQLFKSSY